MGYGDISPHPLTSGYKPPPFEFPRWSFLFLVVAFPMVLLSIVVLIYSDNGYPHGPEVFAGYDERCDGEGKCNQVAVYTEDTTGLNNPTWVTFLRE